MPPVKSPILAASDCIPRCDAVVDLISRVQRPYLFRVTVTGQPPHLATRRYEVTATAEWEAAREGMARFCREMSMTQRLIEALAPVYAR
jgi:hypothetical protein